MTTPDIHDRHNHDSRRYGTFSQQTGAVTTQDTVSVPASLIEAQQAQQDQTAGAAQVQDIIPHRPLGL